MLANLISFLDGYFFDAVKPAAPQERSAHDLNAEDRLFRFFRRLRPNQKLKDGIDHPMKPFLEVKIASLAAEARIIRRLARRHSGEVKWKMNDHRKVEVRREARASLLAYAFLRGKRYRLMEEKCHTQPNWKRVAQIVQKFNWRNDLPVMIPNEAAVAVLKKWAEAN